MNEKKDRYTVLTQTLAYNDWIHMVWADAEKRENVSIIYNTIWQKNAFLRRMNKIHLKCRLPFKRIWIKKYMEDFSLSENDNNFIFINDVNIIMKNDEFIKFLQNKYKANVILYVFNPIEKKRGKGYIKGIEISKLKKWYDFVVTSDPDDAQEFGLGLIYEIYSKLDIAEKGTIKNDLMFVGRGKGREELLLNIYEYLKEKNIDFEINICGKGENRGTKLQYTGYMPYSEIIGKVMESNCILEILQQGQSGLTQRTMEAIVYNKKLLTNNKNIVKLPFYNKDYIQVFENPADINIEFVKKKISINYGYKGEYSSSVFIDKAVEMLKESKGD